MVRIAAGPGLCYINTAMEELFGNPAYKTFVLQDRKRLPARFFAGIFGRLTALPV